MPPIEALLSERQWLRRLSVQLVRDEHAAEDLAQETTLAAMRYAPSEPRDFRAWLASVARSLAAKSQRKEKNRAARESHVARPEATADATERFTLQHSVAEAVLALDEPYRTTLLLRYWDDLPLREVARQMDVPLETVRTRIRRALKTLRGRLDAEHGGRSAWILPLANFAKLGRSSGPVATGAGALVMSKKLLVLPLILVLTAIALVFGPFSEGETETPNPNRIGKDAASATPSSETAGGTTTEDSPAAERSQGKTGARLATLDLRIRFASDRSKAADVGVLVRRTWQGGDPRLAAALSRERGHSARTDEEGTLVLPDLPAGDYLVQLDRCSGRQVRLAAGERKTVQIEIPEGVTVTGKVIDPASKPVPGARVFRLTMAHPDYAQELAITDAQGRFFVRDVEDGTEFLARAEGWQPSESGKRRPDVRGAPGTKDTIEIRLGARAHRVSGRVISSSGRPAKHAMLVYAVDEDCRENIEGLPEVRRQRERRGGLDREPIVLRCDGNGSFDDKQIPWGEALLLARGDGEDRNLVAAELVHVHKGTNAPRTVVLRPGGAMTGVVATADGRPLAGLLLEAEWRGSPEFGSLEGDFGERIARRSATTDEQGRFLIDGLFPGEFEVRYVLTGREGRTFTFGRDEERLGRFTVASGETLQQRFTVVERWETELRFVDENSAPVSGYFVILDPKDARVVRKKTDAEGRVRFQDLRGESARISVHGVVEEDPKRWRRLPLWSGEVRRPGPDGPLRLQLSQGYAARAWGRLLDSSGPAGNVHLRLRRKGFQEEIRVRSGEDGNFAIDELPPGEYEITVRSSAYARSVSAAFELQAGQQRDLGTLRLTRNALLRVFVGSVKEPKLRAYPKGSDSGIGIGMHRAEAGSWVSKLAPGDWYVVARSATHAPVVHDVRLEEGEQRELRIELQEGVPVPIRIQHAAPDPKRSARLPHGILEGEAPRVFFELRDSEGRRILYSIFQRGELESRWVDRARRISRYVLRLRPGSYRLLVREELRDAPEDAKASTPLEVPESGTAREVRITLRRP